MGRPAAKSGAAAAIKSAIVKSTRMVPSLIDENTLKSGILNQESRDIAHTPGIARFKGFKSARSTKAMPSASSEQSSQNEE